MGTAWPGWSIFLPHRMSESRSTGDEVEGPGLGESSNAQEGHRMEMKILQEKLQSLPCHFTWDLEFEDMADVEHLQKFLTLQVKYTSFRNRETYFAMKAFLYHHQRRYRDALGSLQEAEKTLLQDHPDNLQHQALLVYGNYAWVYYHLSNYRMVLRYLSQIYEIGQSLLSPVWVPELLVQRGWSLLAAGAHRFLEATECFEEALGRDPSNEELKAGLAMALYATWDHLQLDHCKEKATELLEQVVLAQPANYEAKVYLARLLVGQDEARAKGLLEEVVENSLSPEVLRRASKWGLHDPQWLPQAVSILEKAIALDSTYHVLYYELGMCHKAQAEAASPERRATFQASACESFQRAAQMNALFADPMLELAALYGQKLPACEEEIYANLLEEAAHISRQCRQAVYLRWGDSLLRRGQKQEALEKYSAGMQVAGGLGKGLLGRRLVALAEMFWEESQTSRAEAIHSLLRTVGYEEAGPVSPEGWWHNRRVLR